MIDKLEILYIKSLLKITLLENFSFNYMEEGKTFVVTWMDASKKKPTDKMKLAKWDKNEAQIMSWILDCEFC